MISDLKRRKDEWLVDRYQELDAKTSLLQSMVDEKYVQMNGVKKEMHEIDYELKIRKAAQMKVQRIDRQKQIAEIKKQQAEMRRKAEEAKKQHENNQNKNSPSKTINKASN